MREYYINCNGEEHSVSYSENIAESCLRTYITQLIKEIPIKEVMGIKILVMEKKKAA